MNKAELNAVVISHLRMGRPEADDLLNDSNRAFIADFATTHGNACCLSLNPHRIFPTTNNINNFSCDFVLAAPMDRYEEIITRVVEYNESRPCQTMEKYENLTEWLITEFGAISLLWS